MSLYCLLNDKKFKVPFCKFYHPLLLIDVKPFQMLCNSRNSFLFFIENPRTNIDLVSGYFEFYFRSPPEDFTLGQVVNQSVILYSTMNSSPDSECMPCILFTMGYLLQEILIYLPTFSFPFHRELLYHFFPLHSSEQCVVCFEEVACYNVHEYKSEYRHMICHECVLRIKSECPLCRLCII